MFNNIKREKQTDVYEKLIENKVFSFLNGVFTK
jgi:hypothetical protein